MHRTYNDRPLPYQAPPGRSKMPIYTLGALLLFVALYCAYALLRPIPSPQVTLTPPVLPALIKVNIPWPTLVSGEQVAFGADGYGLLAHKFTEEIETPVPTASVAKIITALVVLDKKPLKLGEQGPIITLSQHDADLYNQYVAKDGSVVPVFAGEKISEYQALQALMLPSANNIADTLAEWTFGSLSSYNIHANTYVKKLGMTSTTVTDASGFAPSTVSTAPDLVRLGDAALDNPVIAEIMNQKTADFPEYGTIRNVNTLLDQSGIRGIKTGNTDEAGGSYLCAADVMIGGKKITVITAIMKAPSLGQAMRTSVPLIDSAPSQFQNVRVVRAGQLVGSATTPWGSSSEVRAARDITATAWTGTTITPKVSKTTLDTPANMGDTAGMLDLKFNGTEQRAELRLAQNIAGPNAWWRLSHPL